jgi:hypothetical protein
MARIYVASSWRNYLQPTVVDAVRDLGHEVYDFRNPTHRYDNPDGLAHGFHWSEIDPDWQTWSPPAFRQALAHPVAEQGFRSDESAMTWADTCVLVLPCGRSAHAEAGWMAGQGKTVYALITEPTEPELMYRLFTGVLISLDELRQTLGRAKPS